MGILFGIGAAILAIGAAALVVYAIHLTIRWLKEKIKNYFANKNCKKVAVASLEKLVDECDNTMNLDEFMNQGTDVLATIDYNGQVEKVELVNNTDSRDPEIERLYGREDMVVITR